jgi:DnaJ-domain-containing protein 1
LLTLGFSPLIPAWALWALAAAVAALALLAAVSRGPVALVRALALALVLAALANPSLIQEEREKVRDIVAVVVDRSTSQTLGDRAAMTDKVRAELQRRLASLPDVEARFVEAVDAENDDGTRLFAALSNALADVPPDRLAGVILVTDGVVHDIPASTALLGFRAPLHALVTGRPDERDRRIALTEAPRFGIVGKDQQIRAQVLERGGTGQALVTVRRDGQQIVRREVRTGAPFSLTVRIEHGGPNVVEIEAEALPGELTTANNRAVVTIEGIREKLRVLLVSGEPHAGERTWRNLLKSDANVDLVHFTILRPPEKQDGTPINELSLIAFPTRELFQQKIKEFDLIIFDRYANQSVLPSTYFDNIVRYVREGGAVMVAAGPEFAGASSLARTRLSPIIPGTPDGRIVEEPYRAAITAGGRRHPVTRELPGSEQTPPAWGEWLRLVGAQVRTGSAVMSGASPDQPLLVLAREDKGRVALLLSDHAWLWARGFREGGPHLDLLRRLAHWLMKEPALEEEALRAFAAGRDIRIERQTMAETADAVTLVGPSGAERTVALSEEKPGLFTAQAPARELGLHTLRSGDLVAFVSVGPANPRELTDVFSDTEALRPIAEATGGSVRRVAAEYGDGVVVPRIQAVRSGARFSGGDWIGIRPSDSAIVRGVSVFPLALGLLGLALLVGAALAAWLAEGRRPAS